MGQMVSHMERGDIGADKEIGSVTWDKMMSHVRTDGETVFGYRGQTVNDRRHRINLVGAGIETGGVTSDGDLSGCVGDIIDQRGWVAVG